MTGLEELKQLPDEIKSKIIVEWGSIENFYKKAFELIALEYKLSMQKPSGYQQRVQTIENEILDIEDKLEEFADGCGDIIVEIRSDLGDIIIYRNAQKLDSYLTQSGLEYQGIRKWMSDNYGI